VAIESDSQLRVVGLEVEFCAWRSHSSRDLVVQLVYVGLEVVFAILGSQVERESLGILNDLALLGTEPNVVVLVHEVPVPGLVTENTEVLDKFQGIQLGYN